MPRTEQRDLLERLEALHLIIVEIDAYHNACEEQFHRVQWRSRDRSTLQRDLARLDCFVLLTSATITKLVDESRATIKIAVMRLSVSATKKR